MKTQRNPAPLSLSLIALATLAPGLTSYSLAHSYRAAEMEVLPDPASVIEVKLSKNDEISNFDLRRVQDFFRNGTNLGNIGRQKLEEVIGEFAERQGLDLNSITGISSEMIIDRSYNLYSFQLINPHFLWISNYHEHGEVPRMTTIFLENPNTPLEVEGLPFEEFLKKRKADREAQ